LFRGNEDVKLRHTTPSADFGHSVHGAADTEPVQQECPIPHCINQEGLILLGPSFRVASTIEEKFGLIEVAGGTKNPHHHHHHHPHHTQNHSPSSQISTIFIHFAYFHNSCSELHFILIGSNRAFRATAFCSIFSFEKHYNPSLHQEPQYEHQIRNRTLRVPARFVSGRFHRNAYQF